MLKESLKSEKPRGLIFGTFSKTVGEENKYDSEKEDMIADKEIKRRGRSAGVPEQGGGVMATRAGEPGTWSFRT